MNFKKKIKKFKRKAEFSWKIFKTKTIFIKRLLFNKDFCRTLAQTLRYAIVVQCKGEYTESGAGAVKDYVVMYSETLMIFPKTIGKNKLRNSNIKKKKISLNGGL